MVRWAYIPPVLFISVTYVIRIWIRIPRSKVLHSCVTAALICGQKKNILHVKSLPTKGQDKKKRKREDNFSYVVCAYVYGN